MWVQWLLAQCRDTLLWLRVPFSSLAGTHFLRVIPDSGPAAQNPKQVKRVLFCTGKVYYDLTRERKARQMEADVAITRVEQVSRVLSPPCLQAGGSAAPEMLPHVPCVTSLCVSCSSPHSPLTFSTGKPRNTQLLSWCGARRSTRTRAIMTTSNPGFAPPSTVQSQSGKDAAGGCEAGRELVGADPSHSPPSPWQVCRAGASGCPCHWQ